MISISYYRFFFTFVRIIMNSNFYEYEKDYYCSFSIDYNDLF